MLKTKILQGDYTLSRSYYQIKLPIDPEPVIPNNDPVRLLNACVEGMDLSPDNATIARFISLHLSQCPKEIMAESTWLLRRNGFITSEAVFIDGTKIEANANKYTFVWKKAVNKHQEKMPAQSVIVAVAHNINRLHRRIRSGKTAIRLYELKKTA